MLLLVACTAGCLNDAAGRADATPDDSAIGDSAPGDSATSHTGSSDSGGPDTSAPDSGPGETGSHTDVAPPIEYDCDALPAAPIEDNELDGALGYHDVAFDDSGHLLGWDTRATLMKSQHDGSIAAFAPGFDSVQGIDRLRDGDFVVGADDDATLWRVTADGTRAVMTTDLPSLYGVMVGPDGMVYVGSAQDVVRVDPDTGAKETLLHLERYARARAVGFSPDNATMYVATVGQGQVYSVPLDGSLNPAGEAVTWVERAGGRWHDALGVDACGNVYVAEFYSAGLHRIAPDGTVTALYAGSQQQYGHGLEWGSGIGGWRADALYLPQPYDGNTIREVVIGVPSANLVRPTW